MFSGDGEWYSASVSGVTAADTFLITFAEYGNQEEVHRSNVRPRPDSSEVYRGVSAPKRKAVAEAPQLEEMPKVTFAALGYLSPVHVTSACELLTTPHLMHQLLI